MAPGSRRVNAQVNHLASRSRSGTLAEALFLEGHTVETTGPATKEIVNDGLRGTDDIWSLRDWPAIRRI